MMSAKLLVTHAALGVLIVVVGLIVAGQFGLLAGKRPGDLGAVNGRLKPPPGSPNCVSSQSSEPESKIDPLGFRGDGRQEFARLLAVIESIPGASVIERRPEYAHVEFRSTWLGFVDDAEFLLADGSAVIHVRSASRLGYSDFGVNRRRVEFLRARMLAAGR